MATRNFMHFNKGSIKYILNNILGHDIIHDYGPPMEKGRWQPNYPIVQAIGVIGGGNKVTKSNELVGGVGWNRAEARQQQVRYGYMDKNPRQKQINPVSQRNQNYNENDRSTTLTEIHQLCNYAKSRNSLYSEYEKILDIYESNKIAIIKSLPLNTMYSSRSQEIISSLINFIKGLIKSNNEQIEVEMENDFYRKKNKETTEAVFSITYASFFGNYIDFFGLKNDAAATKLIRSSSQPQLQASQPQPQLQASQPQLQAQQLLLNQRKSIKRSNSSDLSTTKQQAFTVNTNIINYIKDKDLNIFDISWLFDINENSLIEYGIPRYMYEMVQSIFTDYVYTGNTFDTKKNIIQGANPQVRDPNLIFYFTISELWADFVKTKSKEVENVVYSSFMESVITDFSVKLDTQKAAENLRIDTNTNQTSTWHTNHGANANMVVNPPIGGSIFNQKGGAPDPILSVDCARLLTTQLNTLLDGAITQQYTLIPANPANPANPLIAPLQEISQIYDQYWQAVANCNIKTNAADNSMRYNTQKNIIYDVFQNILTGPGRITCINGNGIGAPQGQMPPLPNLLETIKASNSIFKNINIRSTPDLTPFKNFKEGIKDLFKKYYSIVSVDDKKRAAAAAAAEAELRKEAMGVLTVTEREFVLKNYCTFMARCSLYVTDIIDEDGIVKIKNPHPAVFGSLIADNSNKITTRITEWSARGVGSAAQVDALGGQNSILAKISPIALTQANNYLLLEGGLETSKQIDILLHIAKYAGFGMGNDRERNLISDLNYLSGWGGVSSWGLDEKLIEFFRDENNNFEPNRIQENAIFCRGDTRKYVINNAAAVPASNNANIFCPYSSILDGMSNCSYNKSIKDGRELGDMWFYYIGLLADNVPATEATNNLTSYYEGKLTINNDNIENVQIELNIRPKDNWPGPLIHVQTTTTLNNNNSLEAHVVLRETLDNFLVKVTGLAPVQRGSIINPLNGDGFFTRLLKTYFDTRAAPVAPAADPFNNFFQEWVYPHIPKKGIGDIFQEINSVCKYGGYSTFRQSAATPLTNGMYRVGTNRIISYLEAPKLANSLAPTYTDNSNTIIIGGDVRTGDQIRLFLAEDRPSGTRFGFVKKYGRIQDINQRSYGGYYDGTDTSFLVKTSLINPCTGVAAPAGGSRSKRKTKKNNKQRRTIKRMKRRQTKVKRRQTKVKGMIKGINRRLTRKH